MSERSQKTQIGVRVPADLLDAVDRAAAGEGRTRANMVIQILREAMEQRRLPSSAQRGKRGSKPCE